MPIPTPLVVVGTERLYLFLFVRLNHGVLRLELSLVAPFLLYFTGLYAHIVSLLSTLCGSQVLQWGYTNEPHGILNEMLCSISS